jgi:hypothetical protein
MAGETQQEYEKGGSFFQNVEKQEEKKNITLPVEQSTSRWPNYDEKNFDPCGIN